MDDVAAAVAGCQTAVQERQLGTADAVAAAAHALAGFAGDILILAGDTPLISSETLSALVAARREPPRPGLVVLGMRPADPSAYGRLITGPDGNLDEIVEFRDATPEQRAIGLCNSGIMAVDGARLFALLAEVGDDNSKKEFYLTDIVALARAKGLGRAVVEAPADELLGINSRAELAAAEAILQTRLRQAAMTAGATLLDPASTFFSFDTVLGRDVVVEPNVFFGPGVTVGDNARVRAFSHLEGASLAAGASVGPYARLRPGARIGAGARVGNFVEVKNATLEEGAKASHLSYIGDARIGAGTNIGAGTITCNYDGFDKFHTDIGAGAFIGSNTALVAPVKVGEGAIVGAGSVVTKDVPTNALALARAPQTTKPEWAQRYRKRKE